MAKYSPAQLSTLARIKFNGLTYYYSGEFPMTYLDVPVGFHARLNSATVRRLERDGLIEPDAEAEDYEHRWIINRKGEALLREHEEYLAPAGREAGMIQGRHLLRELGITLPSANKRSAD